MYKIEITKKALKFIQKQPKPIRELLLRAISNLPAGDVKALQGHNGLFRLRVGNYRIIYTMDNDQLIICVIDAGNRGQIYNDY